MSRRYDRISISGRIELTEDFASRATQEQGVAITIDKPLTIDTQDDPLLLALLREQRAVDEARLVRHYAESQGMLLSTF